MACLPHEIVYLGTKPEESHLRISHQALSLPYRQVAGGGRPGLRGSKGMSSSHSILDAHDQLPRFFRRSVQSEPSMRAPHMTLRIITHISSVQYHPSFFACTLQYTALVQLC